MVLGQFSDICGPANIRKLAKDHKGYGSAATERYIYILHIHAGGAGMLLQITP
jgi:hypothetical protein